MQRLLLSFLAILLLYTGALRAQSAVFQTYNDHQHQFSVDPPGSWAIKNSPAQGGTICVPVTDGEKAKYRNCYEGIVFRMEFYTTGLDSALLSSGLYTRAGNVYYTSEVQRQR